MEVIVATVIATIAVVDQDGALRGFWKDNDLGRFQSVLSCVAGKRLTYRELTDHGLSAAY